MVSATKSCAVATSIKIVRALAVAVKGASVKPVRGTKSLGSARLGVASAA